MREIKFRAWDRRVGKMWHPIVRPDGVLMTENSMGGYITFHDQKPSDPLMQYTGLKDKNGQEIYEGDILRYHWQADDVFWLVGWCSQDAGFDLIHPPSGSSNDNWEPEILEVIGNIHENPELLEAKA
jgi:uncharacterized phage protein (TIGR01671 family)